jgi:hypothetical protein
VARAGAGAGRPARRYVLSSQGQSSLGATTTSNIATVALQAASARSRRMKRCGSSPSSASRRWNAATPPRSKQAGHGHHGPCAGVLSEALSRDGFVAPRPVAPELHGIGTYEYGWADKDDVGANASRGLNEEVVRDISAKKSEPEWMLDLRLKGLKLFDRKPMPTWGADLRHRLRQHQVLRALHREAGRRRGTTCPRTSRTPTRSSASPRRSAAPRLRCRGPVRVRGRLPPDPRGPGGAGRHLPGHRHGAPRAPGALPGVLRHGHPGRRQQVRRAEHGRLVGRLVRLRPQGRARRHPAAGLLPHQHREHGSVRADADHRRRGQPTSTTSRAAPPRSTPRTRCTPPSSRSS